MYLNPSRQWLHNFEFHLFTLRTTKALTCNYCRRFKRSLMPQKEKNYALRAGGQKHLNKMKNCKFFLFGLNIIYTYIFFHLVLPFSCYRIYLHVSQKTKVTFILIFKFKSFSHPALNASFFLLEHQWAFETPWFCKVYAKFVCVCVCIHIYSSVNTEIKLGQPCSPFGYKLKRKSKFDLLAVLDGGYLL